MRPKLQLLGQSAHGEPPIRGTADGEQGLVLLRRQPLLRRRRFAEAQKTPERVAEARQQPIFGVAQAGVSTSHAHRAGAHPAAAY